MYVYIARYRPNLANIYAFQLIDAADPQKNKLDETTIGIIQVGRPASKNDIMTHIVPFQALLIYATPLLLSPSAEQRAMGYVKLAYVIPVCQITGKV